MIEQKTRFKGMHNKSACFGTSLRMDSSSDKNALPWLEANRVKGTHEEKKSSVEWVCSVILPAVST
jgi:hypothetical protein